jgi:hypothetical protein
MFSPCRFVSLCEAHATHDVVEALVGLQGGEGEPPLDAYPHQLLVMRCAFEERKRLFPLAERGMDDC